MSLTQEEWWDIMTTQEELDPELAAYREVNKQYGFDMIRHPLLYSIMHVDQMNAMVNKQLQMKREQLARARAAGDWNTFVYTYEKPYRITAFTHVAYLMRDRQYWELLGSIWVNSENIYQEEDLWREALSCDRYGRYWMMEKEERDHLKGGYLKTLQVYRGFHNDGREHGLSWTANPITAKWFARRHAQSGEVPRVATGTIDKKSVIAFFNGRSETEMVIFPENVRDVTIEEVGYGKERPGF
jgi:hypothetical protein